jgi:hypothetical protein
VTAEKAAFRTTGTGRPVDLTFKPFFSQWENRTAVYFERLTDAQWSQQEIAFAEEQARLTDLQARTVDMMYLGEMQPERDHAFSGEKTITGEEHNRKWRIAESGGYFTFTMKVDSAKTNSLLCTYWGMDNRGRTFDILVNDVKIATEDINKYKGSKFYDVIYPVPAELTKGKDKVTIRFQPKAYNMVGPVYGEVRMTRH